MRAAILAFMGFAPTAVLGKMYLATNLTGSPSYMGLISSHDSTWPDIVSNTTGSYGYDMAAFASINNKTELTLTSSLYFGVLHTVGVRGNDIICTDNFNNHGKTTGFSFDKDGNLSFGNQTGNGFRVCPASSGIGGRSIRWEPTSTPMEAGCSYVSFTAVES